MLSALTIHKGSAEERAAFIAGLGTQMRALDTRRREASGAPLEQALKTVTEAIQANWSTGGGRRLRLFIWSLWNQHTLCNLFDLCGGLDAALGDAVCIVFRAAMCGALTDDQKRRVLTDSGEMARFDLVEKHTPDGEVVYYPAWPLPPEDLAAVGRAAVAQEARYKAERARVTREAKAS
jgi:hypothetical protein